ncbi:MAG: DMT family transporter [Synergistaceae bacterium]|nr:DMT family transporter [Synergistaceae bacterium]
MNRIEANLSLLIITFFASVQYAFLIWVPESVSHFAFMCITNLVGLIMSLCFFFGELFRLDIRQVKQSVILSGELVIFNLFLLMGIQELGTTITNALLSTNFVFIALVAFLTYKKLPSRETLYGIFTVLAGLFIMASSELDMLFSMSAFYLMLSNLAFAFYLVSVGEYSSSSNPAIIAMGQMFFCFVFSLVLWAGEAVFMGADFSLPTKPEFWGSVIYVSFFIRGLYGIVQVYAQRYVSALSASLIFSTAIIMTMAVSPIITKILGIAPEVITWPKIIGGVFMIVGILMTEPEFVALVRRLLRHA